MFFSNDEAKDAILISKSSVFFVDTLDNYDLKKGTTHIKFKS